MILHPAIIALVVSSILIAVMALYSSFFGLQILRHWDIASGSERQLLLERRTYLVSTLLTYMFGFQLISLFLYVFNADRMHVLFTGAMCAAGTLNVNAYGYPALLLKMFNFILAGLWLVWNYADNKAYDYPLTRKKYLLLVFLTPFLVAEAVVQAAYFSGLHPEIITSCCGSLFSTGAQGLGATLSSVPELPAKVALFLTFGLAFAGGVLSLLRAKGAYFFAAMSGLFFLTALSGIVSFVSIYVYELPSHHCPFCLLHREYNFVGYPLYISLFAGAISGLSAGILAPFNHLPSLSVILPGLQKKLTIGALILFSVFMILVVYLLASSGLRMD